MINSMFFIDGEFEISIELSKVMQEWLIWGWLDYYLFWAKFYSYGLESN